MNQARETEDASAKAARQEKDAARHAKVFGHF